MPNAIVTGSSTGIGRAVATRLAREGYSVVVNSRSDTVGGMRVAEEIKEEGGSATYFQADVSSLAGVRGIFDAAMQFAGEPPAILVNNAGATRSAEFGRWEEAHWSDMLNTNLVTTALMSQEFSLRLGDQGEGCIVNIASIRGLERFSRIGAAAYSAAKSGVINLTGALARELAPRVRVNCISPGVVETAYVARADQTMIDLWLSNMAIKRFVQADEVADIVMTLVRNRAMNGANVVVDGGWTQTPN